MWDCMALQQGRQERGFCLVLEGDWAGEGERGKVLCLPLTCCSYEKWKQKNKVDERDEDEENQGGREQYRGKHRRGHGEYPNKHQSPYHLPITEASKRGFTSTHGCVCSTAPQRPPTQGKVRSELKNKQQILKQRKAAAKQRFLQRGGLKRLKARNRQRVQELRQMAFGRVGATKKGKLRKKM